MILKLLLLSLLPPPQKINPEHLICTFLLQIKTLSICLNWN